MKPMEQSNPVGRCFARLCGCLAEAPDVTVQEESSLSAVLHIQGHPPLTAVQLSYPCHNRFWTREYDASYRLTVPGGASSPAELSFRRGRFSGSDDDAVQRLNQPFLLERLSALDFTRLSLRRLDGNWTVELRVLNGSCVRMLFPPLTHYLNATPAECVAILQVLQVIAFIL